ncbi:hypothetical protein [Bacillus sp. B15-48]|uniref:hypothetical protein n=1 Tax=Bacillus sp. B15-48 TaxID=1548601 RepID=UPI00193FD995|nr:hypothetical protein [Bacillus sp. B15-48]MBM4764569.1 hypothetical protein [Bacillus sp. B15-48]
MKAIARQIALVKPDLVGLQEAERWQLEIPNLPIVTFDFVSLLLAELKRRGLHYEIAAENRNFLGRLPDLDGITEAIKIFDYIYYQINEGNSSKKFWPLQALPTMNLSVSLRMNILI